MKENLTASARPRAWPAIPGFPSCNTQASGTKPSVAARTAGRAAIEEGAISFVYENDSKTAREWAPAARKLRADPALSTIRQSHGVEPDAANQTQSTLANQAEPDLKVFEN